MFSRCYRAQQANLLAAGLPSHGFDGVFPTADDWHSDPCPHPDHPEVVSDQIYHVHAPNLVLWTGNRHLPIMLIREDAIPLDVMPPNTYTYTCDFCTNIATGTVLSPPRCPTCHLPMRRV